MRNCLRIFGLLFCALLTIPGRSDGDFVQAATCQMTDASVLRGDYVASIAQGTFAYSPGDVVAVTLAAPTGEQLVVDPGSTPLTLEFNMYMVVPPHAGMFNIIGINPVLTFDGLTGENPGQPYAQGSFHVAGQRGGFDSLFSFHSVAAPFSFTSATVTFDVPDGAGSLESQFVGEFDFSDNNQSHPPFLSLQPIPEPVISGVLILPLLLIRRRLACRRTESSQANV